MTGTGSNDHLFRMSSFDGILIGLITIISVSWLFDIGVQAIRSGEIAYAYENGAPIEKVDLTRDGTTELTLEKGSMKIEVEKGRIRVSESSCPHKTCVNTNWVRRARRPIICVPNRVLIEIEGEVDPGIHAETY